MNSYIDIIKTAIMFFPFIAFLISFPFILIQYHKYGSISLLKVIIIYSFTLYLLSAYFLVILPLPKISVVAAMTSPRTQLIPFSFVIDFIKHSSFNIMNVNTYIKAFKESYFYVPLYNILLTLPFGVYLRYYFKCNIKKVTIYTFLLSLFFELTQLTGLYFIYPRGYRLFDVDDLILNTLGGVLGFLLIKPLLNILPKRDKIDLSALEKGKKMSGFRRATTFLLDLFIVMFMSLICYFLNMKYLIIVIGIIYYFIIPIFFNNSTLGQKFLNSKIVDYNSTNNIIRMLFRKLIFILIYFGIPFIILKTLEYLKLDSTYKGILIVCILGIIFLIYMISFIKYVFTSKDMFYEKVSKTKLVSTIK